jgi:peptide/nickel transport system ATP-binding protein
VTALSILRLVSSPGRIVGGEISYEGRNLLTLNDREMRAVRGNEIAMIFQDPMTSLNPVYKVGEVRAGNYPHEMSGGMRQRVMIAMALACDPKLLIADEPTTALDVTIQGQILDLLNKLREKRKLALLLITHDLGVVAEIADRVAVMYSGKIVEQAGVKDLFARPLHPYTEGLLRAVPRLDESGKARGRRLETIEGVVPNPIDPPPGCRFGPRCDYGQEQCRSGEIDLAAAGPARWSRCLRVSEIY